MNSKIPDNMMISMREYIDNGRPMGGFLTSLFANDLYKTISKADGENIKIIKDYVLWMIWESPQGCHGSYEKVEEWIKFREEERMNK